MSLQSFSALEAQLVELFQNKQYAAALTLIEGEGASFPQERVWVDYWRMCAAARLGKTPLVIQIAEQRLADGLWYGDLIWRTTPSFQSLQGNPDFERIVAASRAAEELDTPTDKPVLHIHLPENHSNTSPLLFALHGNETTASHTLPFWQVAVSKGWVLALPQSNQSAYNGAYVWNDLNRAFANIQAHFTRLQQQIAFDPRCVVLAAHSLGGLVAIQMALEKTLNVCGFLAIAPVLPFQEEPEKLEALLDSAHERGLRGYFILGAQDDIISVGGVRAFAERLQSAGIACELEIVPDAAHGYSPTYNAAVIHALAFLNPGMTSD